MPARRYAISPGLAYRTTDMTPLVWEVVENAWNRNLDSAGAAERRRNDRRRTHPARQRL